MALRAQLLTAERPTDLLDTVRHLTLLPTEPTAPIAPSSAAMRVRLIASRRAREATRPGV